jgi:23S rRNA (guanosine2251-2'-O)-methyltransferase
MILGVQPVREAIRAHGSKLDRLLVEQGGGPKIDSLARYAADQGVAVDVLSRGEMDRKAAGGRHQGVIAVAPDLRLFRVEDIKVEPSSIVVALDGIMDPQNFGAVIRSAVALGARTVMWPEHSSAPLSPATFRASAGAVEHAMLCRVPSLPDALMRLAEQGVTTIALDATGPVELSAVALDGPVAIVIGSEDKGARRAVRRSCHHVARLPMLGPVASLNASVAGAIALYEIVRQRQAKG